MEKQKKKFNSGLPTFIFYITVEGLNSEEIKETIDKTRENIKDDGYNSFIVPILQGNSRIEVITLN